MLNINKHIVIIFILLQSNFFEIYITKEQICNSEQVNNIKEINCWIDDKFYKSFEISSRFVNIDTNSDKICIYDILKLSINCIDIQYNNIQNNIDIKESLSLQGFIRNTVFGSDFSCSQNYSIIQCIGNELISNQIPMNFNENHQNIKGVQASNKNVCANQYSLVQTANGHVNIFQFICWGDSTTGINLVPARFRSNINEIEQIVDMGQDTVCIFAINHKQCWGLCTGGICDIPPRISDQTNIFILKVGNDNACIVSEIIQSLTTQHKSGKLDCWGSNVHGQSIVPEQFKKQVTDVSVGYSTTCAIKFNQQMSCWGMRHQPFKEMKNLFYSISTGGRHTCGAKNGFQECWGQNDQGQLELDVRNQGMVDGVEPTSEKSDWFEVKQMISAGWDFTCFWARDESIECVGFNQLGQTDVPIVEIEYGVNQSLGIQSIESGLNHSCAIYDINNKALLKCWGSHDEYNQVSLSEIDKSNTKIARVSVGQDFTCVAIAVDHLPMQSRYRSVNGIQCFGLNDFGQTEGVAKPLILTELSSGAAHSCLIHENSSNSQEAVENDITFIICWGSDRSGQSTVPEGIQLAAGIKAGDAHTCLIENRHGRVRCWGDITLQMMDVEAKLMDTSQDQVCIVDMKRRGSCIGENEWGECDVPVQGDDNFEVIKI